VSQSFKGVIPSVAALVDPRLQPRAGAARRSEGSPHTAVAREIPRPAGECSGLRDDVAFGNRINGPLTAVTDGDLRSHRGLIERNVRVRLRYVLPVAQMLLAVFLYWRSDVWDKWAMRRYDMPGPSPAFTFLIAVNVPLAPFRAFLFRYLPVLWDRVFFIATVGLLWYWVALNVESWRRDRKVRVFQCLPLRLIVDTFLAALGVFLGCILVVQGRQIHMNLQFSSPLLAPSVLGGLLAWSLTLIFFFGRDLIQCVRERLHA